MIGTHKEISNRLAAFIRSAGSLDENEVKFPARFIFLLLGKPEEQGELEEIGRSMSTIFNDKVYFCINFISFLEI